jgi:hypothetical protein
MSRDLEGDLMKRFTRVALPFAAAMVLVAASDGCNTPSPFLSPLPDSGLLDGHEISVEGYGYAPHITFDVVQCPAGADTLDDCNRDTVTPATTDDQRHFKTTTFVDATFDNGHGARIDCRRDGACEIVSFAIPGLQAKLARPLHFSGRDGLSVTPDRDLTDGRTVTIRGRTTAEFVKVAQCPRSIDNYTQCDQRTLQVLQVEEDGTFQTEMTLHSHHEHGYDCRVPGECILASDIGDIRTIEDFRIVSPQWAPLEFD